MKKVAPLPFRFVLQPIRKLRIAAFVLQVLSIGFSLAQPLLIGLLLDSINAAAGGAPYENVVRLSIILIAISLLDFAVYYLKDYYFEKAISSGVNLMRDYMLEQALRQSAAQPLKIEKGDALNRILNDSDSYAHYLVSEIPEFLVILFRIIAIYAILLRLNGSLAATAAGLFALYLLLYLFINRRLRVRIRTEREQYSGMMNRAQETLDGYSTIKVNGQETFFSQRFSLTLQKYLNARIGVQRYSSLGNGLLNFFYAIIPITVLAVGAHLVVSGRNTLGTVIAFYSYTHWIIEPVYTLADLNRLRQQALAALPRLKEMIKEATAGRREPDVPPIDWLELKNVCFQYRQEVSVLQDISFRLEKGQRLAITGRSGIGKTSLAHLLLGLNRPVSGDVLINGVALDALEEDAYLRQCAYLPQNAFLFDSSLAENIAFREKSDAWLDEVIQLSSLGSLADRQEISIEGLSGGEKQRIGLARAFYRRPAILICDEPTSSLDENMEELIIQALDGYLKAHPCIFIVITHRKPLLAICDKELRLENAGGYTLKDLHEPIQSDR